MVLLEEGVVHDDDESGGRRKGKVDFVDVLGLRGDFVVVLVGGLWVVCCFGI